jgi:solute carrier family 5 (sodium-coupled monocarboxylate transporter), member 8/12
MIQRFIACKSKRTAQIALVLNAPGCILLFGLCCTCGLIVYANFYKCDPLTTPNLEDRISTPNQLLSSFVARNLGSVPGVSGLFLSALFCGSFSSVSSALNSQASILWHDYLKSLSYFQSYDDHKSLRTTKLLVLVCGLASTGLSFIISTLGGNLVNISTSLNGAFNAPIVGSFLLASLFSFTNTKGTIAAIIAGFAASLWIAIGAYIVKPIYPKLPVSIDGCNATAYTDWTRPIVTQTSLRATNVQGFNVFYSLSYLLFMPFGTIVTILVGLLVSCLSGGLKRPCDNKLILFDLLSLFKLKREKKMKVSCESQSQVDSTNNDRNSNETKLIGDADQNNVFFLNNLESQLKKEAKQDDENVRL